MYQNTICLEQSLVISIGKIVESDKGLSLIINSGQLLLCERWISCFMGFLSLVKIFLFEGYNRTYIMIEPKEDLIMVGQL